MVRLELFWQKPCTRMVEASLALLLLFLVLLAVVVVTITFLKKLKTDGSLMNIQLSSYAKVANTHFFNNVMTLHWRAPLSQHSRVF